jgi:hypothetical protein
MEKSSMMLRKVKFVVLFLSLFVQAGLAAAGMNGEAPDSNAVPEKNRLASTSVGLSPLLPLDNASPMAGRNMDFSWSEIGSATRYRLEVEDVQGKAVFTATLPRGVGIHRVPASRLDASGNMRWRVVALDPAGKPLAETAWRTLLPLSSECEMW